MITFEGPQCIWTNPSKESRQGSDPGFWVRMVRHSLPYMVEKRANKFGQGSPPTPLFGQCPRENIFFRELFPNMWWSILFKLKLYIVGSSAHLTFMTTSIAISETWWVILQSEGCQFPKADDYVRRGGGDPTRKGWDGKQQLRKHCQWHLGNISDSGNNNNNVYGLCLSS